jgi:hypothetical protein
VLQVPQVPQVQELLAQLVLLVQAYLVQRELPEQLEQELPVLLVLLELVVPPEPQALQAQV